MSQYEELKEQLDRIEAMLGAVRANTLVTIAEGRDDVIEPRPGSLVSLTNNTLAWIKALATFNRPAGEVEELNKLANAYSKTHGVK